MPKARWGGRTTLATLVLLACAWLFLPGIVLAQGTATGSQYVTFWRGDLKIIATQPDTEVTLINVTTGAPLDTFFFTGNFAQNPFELRNEGDSFEGVSFGTLWVRIIAQVSKGPNAGADAPVLVFTGDTDDNWVLNAWLSYLPAFSPSSVENGTEIGRDFWGYVTEEIYLFARKGADPTQIDITDLATNVDPDTDDTQTITRASPGFLVEDADFEVYHVTGFDGDTVRITSNTDMAVAVGARAQQSNDWTVTPPSFGQGEDFRELGTTFIALVSKDLTVFPTQDDTTVRITDLSDGDDSIAVNLPQGDLNGDYDIFISDLTALNGTGVAPRPAAPAVRFSTLGSSAPFDNDIVRVDADKPVLLYIGPKSSDTAEYADVAYSIQTGPDEFLVYAYAQNGGAQDLQLFVFDPNTQVNITSLSRTLGFQTQAHHDFQLPLPTPYLGGNATYGDYYWASDVWDGELLRITSDGPLTVMTGDYDQQDFGSFLPFVASSPFLKPIADAGPDIQRCPGNRTVTLDGSGSFDADNTAGGQAPSWTWDTDAATDADGDTNPTNDVDATGEVVSYTFPADGVYTVTLTYTDDDGETDTDVMEVRIEAPQAPEFTCPANLTIATGPDDIDCATPFDQSPSAPDSCGEPVEISSDAPAIYPVGTTAVTWTARDSFGNETTCTQEVTVVDGTAPAITCERRIEAVPDSPTSAMVEVLATATDNCDATVTLENDRTPNGGDATDEYPCGGTFVRFTSPDAAGNVGECTSVVAVSPPGDPVDPGNALRVSKADPEPRTTVRLDWAGAQSRELWEAYVVRRTDTVRIQPFPALSGPGWIDPSYTDADATGADLLFYEVRTRDCTGTISPDPFPGD